METIVKLLYEALPFITMLILLMQNRKNYKLDVKFHVDNTRTKHNRKEQ